MPTQPETPDWATDGTHIVDPPGGTKATGFLPSTRPPAQYINWILNLLGDGWIPYLLGATWGTLRWGGRMWSVGGTSTIPAVTVDAIDFVALSGGFLKGLPPHTYVIGELDSGAVSLSASSVYYCYVSFNTGAAAYLFSSTHAPADTDASGGGPMWKGDAIGVWRYLGCFVTDSGGNPIPFRAHRGRYVFRRSAEATSVGGGTSGTYADLSLAAWMPAHARMAHIEMALANTDTTAEHSASVITRGDTSGPTTAVLYVPPPQTGTAHAVRTVDIETDSTRAVSYKVDDPSHATLVVNMTGFTE